jgi:hypothetical protein
MNNPCQASWRLGRGHDTTADGAIVRTAAEEGAFCSAVAWSSHIGGNSRRVTELQKVVVEHLEEVSNDFDCNQRVQENSAN